MDNIFEIVKKEIEKHKEYVSSDGELLKAKIYSDINAMKPELIQILFNNSKIKKQFFIKVKDSFVFDKQAFAWFLDSKEFLPDSYTKYSNKIGLVSNNSFLSLNNDVVLDFPFKDCLLEFDSTDEKESRKEVFYNEIIASDQISSLLSPKIISKSYLHDSKGKKLTNNYSNENIVLKGNNLLAMYSLLPRYENHIKLMYWDILYNTQNDIVPYNDNFKHTSWLVMMKNRLEVAKRLLNDKSGVICLQCDDNEQAYLKVLCDEIFGRDAFINCIVIKSSEASGNKMAHIEKRFPKIKDYLLVYKSNANAEIRINPVKENTSDDIKSFAKYAKYYSNIIENINDPVNKWIITPISEYLKKNNLNIDIKDDVQLTKFKLENASRVVYRTNNKFLEKLAFKTKTEKVISPNGIQYIWWERKQMLFLSDYTSTYLCDLWTDISTINLNKEGGVELKSGKKPEKLVSRIIKSFADGENDIILDAYLGSGTTAAVCLKMNKKFIGIEQLESHYQKTIARLDNVIKGDKSGISTEFKWRGGGSYISGELKEYGKKYIDEILKADKSNIDKIKKRIFADEIIIPYLTKEEIESGEKEFEQLSLKDKKQALISLIDKNKLYINYSDIDDKDYGITKEEKSFTKSFYEGE